MENVAALYVRNDSIYKMLGVDCWDIERDARNYQGPHPVIAHPPCRAWGKLRKFARPRHDEKELAITAVNQVRKWGGVLEHPASSSLWPEINLPAPGSVDSFGGFSIMVFQSWFGHRAVKKTLLYIVGISPKEIPPYPISLDAVTHIISSLKRRKSGKRTIKQECTKSEREKTPEKFANYLIEIAKKCTKTQ
jgi:hypothetical protein